MPLERLTPERRREMTRGALVEAASELFARKGFNGTSLEEIAEAAGFTRGAIYSNFEGKEDLLLAVVERYAELVLERYRAAGGSPEEPEAMRTYVSLLRGSGELLLLSTELRLYALRNPEFRPRLAEMHARHRRRLVELIEESVERTGIRLRIPAADLADFTWAAGDGIILHAAIDADRRDHWDRVAELLFTVLIEPSIELPGGPGAAHG